MNCINPETNCIMSSKMRSLKSDLCGDCGLQDPAWASINRGILLCSDCVSVHRSLGRHVSIVKSLRQGTWSPSVLNFLNQLNSHGANSVWEHLLLDPVAPKHLKRKPSPKDALHPIKADFIRAKHVNLSYVLKPNIQANEDTASMEIELSKQLHASVRSSNLETSLRLLVQGADPNFVHEEKGYTTPLHIAAKFGQTSQCELLIVYGSDLNALDGSRQNPIEIAKMNKHTALAERLVEALYEVTDRIIHFICGRKPDHAAGQHLLIPDQKNETSEQIFIAKGKLQLIPNKMFEELVMDLYEEVDRRETDAVWSTSSLSNPEIGAVPFLPTNPHLSATRNQGRQKLARFSHTEFNAFLIDVLIDARRRQNIANMRPLDQLLSSQMNSKVQYRREQRDSNLSDDEPLYDAVCLDDDYAVLAPVAEQALNNKSPLCTNSSSNNEVDSLKKQLEDSAFTINELKNIVQKLATENNQLKTRIDSSQINTIDVQLMIDDPPSNDVEDDEVEPVLDNKFNGNGACFVKRPVSMYEARQTPREENRPPITQSLYSMGPSDSNSSNQSLPLVEEVTKRTELVTRRIQELWFAMQEISKKDAFVPCSERIRVAIAELIAIFPQSLNDDTLKNILKQLNFNTNLIQTECHSLQLALANDDKANTGLYLQQVRNCAFNLAKATKSLVTQFQQ